MTLRPCTAKEFRKITDDLRRVCPPPTECELKVWRTRASEVGDTDKKGRRFEIRVNTGLTKMETEDTLIHEWAHMHDWRPLHPLVKNHGPTWGCHLAMIYRLYYEVT